MGARAGYAASAHPGDVTRLVEAASGRSWWYAWAGVTSLAAIAATVLDALLLQQRRSFFTGGFLSVDHITHPSQAAAFLASSLFIDWVALGALAAVVFWICARAGADRRVSSAIALVLAIVPVAAANAIEYQLLTYFGDAFDLSLMFDLTGRSPGEILAVASPQLVFAGIAGLLVLAALVAMIVILLRRRMKADRQKATTVRLRTLAAICCALVALGAVATVAARTRSDVLDNGIRRKPTGRFVSAIVNAASDFDRDGFGLLGRPSDPALFDSHIQPYAFDIPGNGVDEDGIGGDLPRGAEPYVEPRFGSAPWRATPDVVLIVLESFRADAFHATVGGRPVTPILDDLASHGISVPRAYSHNGYTVQSRRHIFTGSAADIDRGTTLVDDFKSRGYQTAYFSAQDESFGGPDQGVGFDRADVAYDARNDPDRRYSRFTTAGSLAVSHEVLNARVGEFLAKSRTAQPLFLYVNFHDTHFPYHHRDIQPILTDVRVAQEDIAPARSTALHEMYLNTASNVDRAIGTLLAHVRHTLGHDPVVIVLSDHGESLFEEGFLGHGYALNNAQTRIPFIVSGLPVTVREPFGQADLRPMLHAALAGETPLTSPPVVALDSSKKVFQYLGTIDRPAEIGFVTASGRVVYDLRSRQARIDDGAWRNESDLTPGDRRAVLDLIQTWERMIIARRGR